MFFMITYIYFQSDRKKNLTTYTGPYIAFFTELHYNVFSISEKDVLSYVVNFLRSDSS